MVLRLVLFQLQLHKVRVTSTTSLTVRQSTNALVRVTCGGFKETFFGKCSTE